MFNKVKLIILLGSALTISCSSSIKPFRLPSSLQEIYYTKRVFLPNQSTRVFWQDMYDSGFLMKNKHLESGLKNFSSSFNKYALEDINQFISEHPDVHYGYEIKGDIQFFINPRDSAISSYKIAINKLSDSEKDVSLNLKILMMARDPDTNIKYANYVIGQVDDTEILRQAYSIRGSAYMTSHKYNLAIDDFTRILKDDNKKNMFTFIQRGECYEKVGQPLKAIKDYTSSIKLKYTLAFKKRAELYKKLKLNRKACKDYQTLLKSAAPQYAKALQETCKVLGCNTEYVKNGFETIKDSSGNILQRNVYRNGQLTSMMNYKDGVFNGLSKSWYPDGTLESLSYHTNDNIDSLRMWHSNGQLMRYAVFKDYETIIDSNWNEKGQLIHNQ